MDRKSNLLPPVESTNEDERFAKEAIEAHERWERERQAVEQAHYEEMRPIKEHLEKARQLVIESGVGEAACSILRIMWHWPSKSERDDWQTPIPVDGLDGGQIPRREHGALGGKSLGWTWDGDTYQMALEIRKNYTDDDFETGDLRMWVADAMVMHLDVSLQLSDGYDSWRVFGVSAFKAGPWMAQLNELAGRLRVAEGQGLRDYEKEFYGEKAKKIDLD
ncbi:MAG: hypothetical protein KQH53_17055 [Desulfarculaceae bacterium]|nr:hypothetical protein [Desulfarculaceae bacterium]